MVLSFPSKGNLAWVWTLAYFFSELYIANIRALSNERESDDLPRALRTPVRRHRDGHRAGRRARRLRTTEVANMAF